MNSINFEKSATYFDSQLAIKRIQALLPHVRLIMMFAEPGIRAYSRYQVKIDFICFLQFIFYYYFLA
jgi:hypothetical protein